MKSKDVKNILWCTVFFGQENSNFIILDKECALFKSSLKWHYPWRIV